MRRFFFLSYSPILFSIVSRCFSFQKARVCISKFETKQKGEKTKKKKKKGIKDHKRSIRRHRGTTIVTSDAIVKFWARGGDKPFARTGTIWYSGVLWPTALMCILYLCLSRESFGKAKFRNIVGSLGFWLWFTQSFKNYGIHCRYKQGIVHFSVKVWFSQKCRAKFGKLLFFLLFREKCNAVSN